MRRPPCFFSAGCAVALTVAAIVALRQNASAQAAFPSGQNVAPVYEGWEKNSDGSFNLVFGYFNRNWMEEIDLPVGPNNTIDPGAPDQGQPTHFLPRRNRFLFRIRVPKDFGNKELIWTLTSHGKTERAYATLKTDYFIDDIVIQNNNGAGGAGGGAPGTLDNKAPTLKVEGESIRRATVGEPVSLTALAHDDGMPPPKALPVFNEAQRRSRGTPNTATGLRLSWFVYRGAGKVVFDPPQITVWEDYRDGKNSPWSAGWAAPPAPGHGFRQRRSPRSSPERSSTLSF